MKNFLEYIKEETVSNNSIIEACKYYMNYIYSSANMKDEFLEVGFCKETCLDVFYDIVSFTDKVVDLYRIVPVKDISDYTIGDKFTIKPRDRITSYTLYNTPSRWSEIAEDIGYDNYIVIKTSSKTLTTPAYIKKLSNKISKMNIKDNNVEEFINIDPMWQKECWVDGNIKNEGVIVKIVEY